MGARDLDEVKEEANGLALLLKVYGNCHKCVVVKRCPHVCGKVGSTIMFLRCVSNQASVALICE